MIAISEGLSEKVLTSVELSSRQASIQNTVCNTNNQPTTNQEKKECSTRLTPQQMHQVKWGYNIVGETARLQYPIHTVYKDYLV